MPTNPRCLTYWDASPNDGRTRAFTAAGNRFCTQEGNLQFRYVPKGPRDYVADILAAAEVGAAPDVIDVRPEWVTGLREAGFLSDLAPWVANWAAADRYDPAHRKLCAWEDGSFPFLACDLFVQGTHYRPDVLQAHGLEDPRALDARGEWTLPRLAAMARAVQVPANGLHGITLRGGEGSELTVFNLMSGALGRSVFEEGGSLLAHPESIEALAEYVALARPPVCCQPNPETAGYLQFAWEFYEGRAAFMLHNDDGVKAAQQRFLGPESYATAGLPVAGGAQLMMLAGFGVGVWRGSPLFEVAARFVLAFVDNYGRRLEESASAFNQGGPSGVTPGPMRPHSTQAAPYIDPFVRFIDNPDLLFRPPYWRTGYQHWVAEVVRPDIARMLQGTATPAECAERWAETVAALV